MAIGPQSTAPGPFRDEADVKIVWKGRRIARLIFPSGKTVEFDELVGPGRPRVSLNGKNLCKGPTDDDTSGDG